MVLNAVFLAAIMTIIIGSRHNGQAVDNAAVQATSNVSANSTVISNPLDKLSSADIALQAARAASLTEELAVANQADSLELEMSVIPSNDEVIAKPQIVATNSKSRKDIVQYVTVAGDTVGSLAGKFGVTSDSIRWSNGLNGDSIPAGKALYIPPINGIVYVVAAGDKPESLAAKYKASATQIIFFNDAEVSGLTVGERILIPDGKIQVVQAASYQYSGGGGFAFGSGPLYGGNGYVYGNCTYYVATKVSVPRNWGNANTWASAARLSGWTVTPIPRVGAIAQTRRMSYLGHVAYVEAVSEDGSQIKYSDMNGLAGYNRVGYSGWVPASTYENYLYH